jgi:hypothetical protein
VTDLNKLVRDLSAAAEEEGVGLAILIDEAQELTPAELTALSSRRSLSRSGATSLYAKAVAGNREYGQVIGTPLANDGHAPCPVRSEVRPSTLGSV